MKNATLFDFARMCKTVKICEYCPIAQNIVDCCDCLSTVLEDTEEVNDIVVKWYPAKTLQNELLAVLPNAAIDEDGVVDICPLLVNKDYIMDTTGNKKCNMDCDKCRRAFWLKELE